MKYITAVILTTVILSGCSSNSSKKKALLGQVLEVHDEVMSADDQLMKNKTQLDTMLKQPKYAANDTVKQLDTKLMLADSAMGTWMHGFDPDPQGKSDDEVVKYFTAQKKQVMAVDSQMKAAVAESNKYLSKIKTK